MSGFPHHLTRSLTPCSACARVRSPYRAPELLFGPRTYDAFAIDAWSLGVTFAEFFTPLRLQTDEDEDEEGFSFQRSARAPESESGSDSSTGPRPPTPPPAPFIIPRGMHWRPTVRWIRTSLFDGTRGEIGLAWSIFKVRGTPNVDTWPVRHPFLCRSFSRPRCSRRQYSHSWPSQTPANSPLSRSPRPAWRHSSLTYPPRACAWSTISMPPHMHPPLIHTHPHSTLSTGSSCMNPLVDFTPRTRLVTPGSEPSPGWCYPRI